MALLQGQERFFDNVGCPDVSEFILWQFSIHSIPFDALAYELLDELDVIECFMEPGKAPIQGEVLKKQEQIYRDLDVTPLLAAGQPADA